MKPLLAEELKTSSLNTSINEVSFFMDSVPSNELNNVPWAQYDYCPEVKFAIAYGKECIFLKYYVNEKMLRAANGAVNSPVYEDSCVEFFISFENDKAYYNFEFNCIGTALVGYGESKTDRSLLPDQLISQVKYQAVINNDQPGDNIHWELTVAIPFTVFYNNQPDTLKGKKCRANFYKCGDQLPTPHFVAWSNIEWPGPNFHLPEFFGNLQFV
jgi:hypothetical protein